MIGALGVRALRRVAGLRGVCYAPWVHGSPLRLTLRETRGASIVEVLAVTIIVGIAVIGVALMFGKGSAWVSATGFERVAAGLAQQRIEQIRACGWEVATADPARGWPPAIERSVDTANPPAPSCPAVAAGDPPLTGLGDLKPDPLIQAANNHTFIRTVCIQYVDPSTPEGLAEPAYESGSCLPGTPTPMVRITVVVESHQGESKQPETSPVTLQAWMHCLESRPSSWVSAPCPSQAAP